MTFDNIILIYVFSVSFTVVGLCAFAASGKFQLGIDSTKGMQKIHGGAISRLGGLGVFAGLTLFCLLSAPIPVIFVLILISLAPIFLGGLLEDLTGNVSPLLRFVLSVASGTIFCVLSGYSITNTGVNELNFILSIPLVSIALTALALAALANSLNIIDGLNGLASGSAIIMSVSLAIVSVAVKDFQIALIALSFAAALAGFFVWNFPFGYIFIGDAGAYLAGGLIAIMAIMLPERNPIVSPFFSLILVSYPFYELVRSVVRRAAKGATHVFEADKGHLHSLMFEFISGFGILKPKSCNSFATIFVILLPSFTSIWAVTYFRNTQALIYGVIMLLIFYEIISFTLKILKSNRNTF